MLRTSTSLLGKGGKRYQGLDVHWAHPKGVPKRTFPMRENRLHPAFAPNPGGFWFGKYHGTMPFVPFELTFYRVPVVFMVCLICLDLWIGLPVPFNRELVPNKPRHYWAGNNGGTPHHFWCYQEGWFVPNESGTKRLVE